MGGSIGFSGIDAGLDMIDVASNNLVNIKTDGYKQQRIAFADVFPVGNTGASANSVGAGVQNTGISQDFSQGPIAITNNNLDLAINDGSNFFIYQNAAGSQVVSRNGSLGLDVDGFLVNQSGFKLMGYLADDLGVLQGQLVPIQIAANNLQPTTTTSVGLSLNLPAGKVAPTGSWVGTPNFGGTAPDSSTYNDSTTTIIYDSLGKEHVMTSYYSKSSDTTNEWEVRVQIDGVDVYTSANKTNEVDTASAGLIDTSALAAIDANDLSINGVDVSGTATSVYGIVGGDIRDVKTIIDAETFNPAVTTAVKPNVINLGSYTPSAFTDGQLELYVNGIIGDFDPFDDIGAGTITETNFINGLNTFLTGTGTAAKNADGEIEITIPGGNTLRVEGGGMNITALSNIDLTDSSVDVIQRGQLTLTSNSPITVAGNAPTDAGLVATTYLAPYKAVFDSNGVYDSDNSETITVNWTPLDENGVASGAAVTNVTLDISDATQFAGGFNVQSTSQNGAPTGTLTTLSIDSSGIIRALYSNGIAQTEAQVALASVANVDGLVAQGGSVWIESVESGPLLISSAGDTSIESVQSGGLERSNADTTQSLVNLNEGRQLYSLATNIIRVEQQNVDDALRIIER